MKHILVILVMLIAFSCTKKSIQDIEKFDPDFHISDYEKGSITNGTEEISCREVKFNDYACMNIEKIKELNKILSRYRRRVPLTSKRVESLLKSFEGIENLDYIDNKEEEEDAKN